MAVRVMHRAGDGAEESEPVVDREAPRVAELVHRQSVHVLHDDERMALLVQPAVEQPRDVRVVERGEHVPLDLEAAANLERVAAVAQHLDRHAPPRPLSLALGEIDHPHPAAAELAEHAIVAHPLGEQRLTSESCDVPLEELAFGTIVGVEQELHLGTERRVVGAAGVEHGLALARGELVRLLEDQLDPLAIEPAHVDSKYSVLNSQARAFTQSRRTVRSVTPSTSATSRSSSPAK